jgi:hypothetical protein
MTHCIVFVKLKWTKQKMSRYEGIIKMRGKLKKCRLKEQYKESIKQSIALLGK